jgi:hypothetical protein
MGSTQPNLKTEAGSKETQTAQKPEFVRSEADFCDFCVFFGPILKCRSTCRINLDLGSETKPILNLGGVYLNRLR